MYSLAQPVLRPLAKPPQPSSPLCRSPVPVLPFSPSQPPFDPHPLSSDGGQKPRGTLSTYRDGFNESLINYNGPPPSAQAVILIWDRAPWSFVQRERSFGAR
ncbi:hypothetical protein KM043_016129 [Ampulex compressa]|nr:hypothetical protein KM043_016129 [Ampulex compressa]